jgi:hypothetical protein
VTTTDDFKYIIQDSVDGDYYVRISTDTGVNTEMKRLFASKMPKATISSGSRSSIEIEHGETVKSGKDSPLRVVIPAGFSTTESYRLRLAATDANTGSGDYGYLATFGTKPNASFGSSSALLDDKGNAKAVVLLTGTAPWRYSYGNDVGSLYRFASVSPDTLSITSKEPSAYFRLMSVTNGCGDGTIVEPSTIRVDVVLGTEVSGSNAEPVTFGPNPTNDRVKLHFNNASKRTLNLYNANGVLISVSTVSETDPEVVMQPYPAGSYLLKIMHTKGEQTLRIVKE